MLEFAADNEARFPHKEITEAITNGSSSESVFHLCPSVAGTI